MFSWLGFTLKGRLESYASSAAFAAICCPSCVFSGRRTDGTPNCIRSWGSPYTMLCATVVPRECLAYLPSAVCGMAETSRCLRLLELLLLVLLIWSELFRLAPIL